jgi:hypothetical protein
MVGCVFVNEDTGEIKVLFLHPHGLPAFFTYPSKPDIFIVNRAHNITEVDFLASTGPIYLLPA